MITSFFPRVTRLNFAPTIIFSLGPIPPMSQISADLMAASQPWDLCLLFQTRWVQIGSSFIQVCLKLEYSHSLWPKKMGIWSNHGNPQVFKPGLIQDPPISNNCSFKIFNCPFSSRISLLATAMMMTSEGTKGSKHKFLVDLVRLKLLLGLYNDVDFIEKYLYLYLYLQVNSK